MADSDGWMPGGRNADAGLRKGRPRSGRPRIRGNPGMFLVMVLGAVFRRRSRALMAVVASLVGAATLFCLMMVCLVVPAQMTAQMRQYGANLVVTPTETGNSSASSSSSDGSASAGIGEAMVRHTTRMVRAAGSARHATYRYENVRINAAPYVLAGIDVRQVKAINAHWSVEGAWPSSGTVLVGRGCGRCPGAVRRVAADGRLPHVGRLLLVLVVLHRIVGVIRVVVGIRFVRDGRLVVIRILR